MPVKTQLLRNRVMLITKPIAAVNTAAIGFWFSVGSRSESNKEYGITHFTEHLLFKGTKSRNTHQLACTFDNIGGMINAYTERDDVCVYSVIPSGDDNLKTALKVLCDMSENCIFPDDELERERTVVENEIVSVEDDSEESAIDKLALCIWPQQSISRSITGSIKDVENLSKKQIAQWYDKYFVHGELTVVATGNINENILIEELQKLGLHKKPLRYPQEYHYNENIKWKNGLNIIKAPFKQNQLYVAFPFHTPVTEKEHYAISVFNALFGDTMSSRLFENLREKNGLCYSVYSFFTLYEDAAAWCAFVSCENKNIVKAYEKLIDELSKIKSSGITDEEIESAKNHICGEETISGDDVEYLLKRIQRNYSLGYNSFDTEDVIKCIRNVTKDDILNLIDELIVKSKKAVMIYGPKLTFNQKRLLNEK